MLLAPRCRSAPTGDMLVAAVLAPAVGMMDGLLVGRQIAHRFLQRPERIGALYPH